MPRKRHQPEEIIQNLRTLEIEQSKGLSLEEIARKIGVTTVTLARWRQQFLGLKVGQAPTPSQPKRFATSSSARPRRPPWSDTSRSRSPRTRR